MIHATYGDGERLFGSTIRAAFDSIRTGAPPSLLCTAMNALGSDKGSGWHNYTIFYDHLLASRRDTTRTVFELGIGSGNSNIPFAMVGGTVGASLRGWRAYFPNAAIVGADVDRQALFREDRITTHFVDVFKNETIAAMWRDVEASLGRGTQFDLIIDDGFHSYEANSNFLINSRQMLAPGGIYVIEDIKTDPANLSRFDALLFMQGMDGVLFTLPNPNNDQDNCIAIMRERS
jgi:hypothetical protein